MFRIHDVGELPVVIQPDPVWHDPVSDRAAIDTAWRVFTRVNLVDRPGRLHGHALDVLHLLARPSVEYVGVVLGRDYQDGVVVAARGDDAVIAYRTGAAVTLTSVRHASLPETLLRQIPDVRPAPIDSVNVRTDDVAAGIAPGHVRTLRLLKRQRLLEQGELHVAVRDTYGRRRRSDPIRYQDYRIGRVIVVIADGYLSVAPATKILLRDRLRTVHRQLTE
jgi:hypothetical protein